MNEEVEENLTWIRVCLISSEKKCTRNTFSKEQNAYRNDKTQTTNCFNLLNPITMVFVKFVTVLIANIFFSYKQALLKFLISISCCKRNLCQLGRFLQLCSLY